MTTATSLVTSGLSLAPFRALRPAVGSDRLGRLLCPPYDVIDEAQRTGLLETDPDNAVGLILPRADGDADPYRLAATRLAAAVTDGMLVPDADPSLYVYEMRSVDGGVTRGLIGAVELRDPNDGVILPHEDTMAGPVADRLALMEATQADLEPIYLVYDGGGAASQLVGGVDDRDAIASATTPDGTSHRLWKLADPDQHAAVDIDLASRRALIADGHHRYATYLELQRRQREQYGRGPWDRGLTLLVDSTSYGPQVHAIHRVLVGVPPAVAVERARTVCAVGDVASPQAGLEAAATMSGFAAVLTDGQHSYVVSSPAPDLARGSLAPGEPDTLADLDVTVLHRVLIERVWQLADTVETVGYAHSVDEALADARATSGTAVLLRPTPVSAVAAIAAAGARMPRKSTLFMPKPASGLVMRRFADDL